MANKETVIDGTEVNKTVPPVDPDVAAEVATAKNAKVDKKAKKVAAVIENGAKDLDDVIKALEFLIETVAALYGVNPKREKLRRLLGGLKMAEHWLNQEIGKV